MTKKKRAHPDIEEILQRPWCYYCERDFDDLKILISHQKAKHFKCERCGRRLNTVGGLSVHLNQVHKESLTTVDNALANRSEVGIEIFGMEGIPEEVLNAHQQRITEVYFRREAERRAETGNPTPGGAAVTEGGVKKAKIETPDDMKRRLAEHKARKLAEKMGLGTGSGDNTPMQGMPANGPPMSDSPQPDFQSPYAAISSSTPPGFNPYQPPPQHQGYPPPQQGFPPQHQGYPPHHPGFSPQQQGYPPFAGSPPQHAPFPTPGFPPSPFTPMGQGFPQGMPPPFPQGPPQQAFQPPPQQHFSSPASSGPPMSGPSLPQGAPGLPQRPSFSLPNLSKEDMAKMHSGAQLPTQPTHHPNGSWTFGGPAKPGPQNNMSRAEFGDELDDLISSVTGQAASNGAPRHAAPSATQRYEEDPPSMPAPPAVQRYEPDPEPMPTPMTPARPSETPAPAAVTSEAPVSATPAPVSADAAAAKPAKKSKKDKKTSEITKLMYSDNAMSPEEKMARLKRYSFDKMANDKTEFVRAEPGGDVGGTGTVTGIIGSDTVRDPQD